MPLRGIRIDFDVTRDWSSRASKSALTLPLARLEAGAV
jgi:hypothetical protein